MSYGGLERFRPLSPSSSPSFSPDRRQPFPQACEQTVAIEGQPFQIRLAYGRSGLRLTAFIPNETGQEKKVGTAEATHEVVNTDALRIISIHKSGDSPVGLRHALHSQLFRFAAEQRLRILPWAEHWNKMDPETRRWLDENELPDHYNINPDI